MEGFDSKEIAPISDEQAVEALRRGPDDPDAVRWFDQIRAELDILRADEHSEEGRKRSTQASIMISMRQAKIYYRSGHPDIAIEDLRDTIDGANSKLLDGSGLFEQASGLLSSMRTGEFL